MSSRRKKTILLGIATSLLAGWVTAEAMQDWGRRRGRANYMRTLDTHRKENRNGVPIWDNTQSFKDDVFTFVRIEYGSTPGYYTWDTDFPDADLNLSYRLQQMTSIKSDPDGKILRFTDKEICDYPFIYVIEPGGMQLSPEEVEGLRNYLHKGGFMMVDDFWGEREWDNFENEMRRVFPNRKIIDLPIEHEIFNIVYPIKEKPMIPSVHSYLRGRTTERLDAREAHYRGIEDDDGRLMMIICHNTDLGDGWEREGVDHGYFIEYSERWAYPLGINIVTYALTH